MKKDILQFLLGCGILLSVIAAAMGISVYRAQIDIVLSAEDIGLNAIFNETIISGSLEDASQDRYCIVDDVNDIIDLLEILRNAEFRIAPKRTHMAGGEKNVYVWTKKCYTVGCNYAPDGSGGFVVEIFPEPYGCYYECSARGEFERKFCEIQERELGC